MFLNGECSYLITFTQKEIKQELDEEEDELESKSRVCSINRV